MRQTPGEITKIDEERKLVFGWAYIAKSTDGTVIVDKQGDFIDDDWELESAAYRFVKDFGGVGDEMHMDVPVSRIVESVVFTPEKLEKMGLAKDALPVGWWVGFQVEDDRVWADVKAGKYRAFSIGGAGVREKVEA